MQNNHLYLDFARDLMDRYHGPGSFYSDVPMVYLENGGEAEEAPELPKTEVTNLYHTQNVYEENHWQIQQLSMLTQILEQNFYQKLYPETVQQISEAVKEKLPEAEERILRNFSEYYLTLRQKEQTESITNICRQLFAEYHQNTTNVQKEQMELLWKLENIYNSSIYAVPPSDLTRRELQIIKKRTEQLLKKEVSPEFRRILKAAGEKSVSEAFRQEALEQGNLTQGSFGAQLPEAAVEQLWKERFVRELSIGEEFSKAENIPERESQAKTMADQQQIPGYEPVRLTYQQESASSEVTEKAVSSEDSIRENTRTEDVARENWEKLSEEAVSQKGIPQKKIHQKEIEHRQEALKQGNVTQGSFGAQFPEAAVKQLWTERFVRELSIGDESQKAEKAPGRENQAKTIEEQLMKQQISQELLELEHPKMAEEIQQKTADIFLAANQQQAPGYEPVRLTYQEELASAEAAEKLASSEDSIRENTRTGDVIRENQKKLSEEAVSQKEIPQKEIERRQEALEQGNLTQGSFGAQFPEAAVEQLWQEHFVQELSIGDESQKAEKAPGRESQAKTAAEQLMKQQISQELLTLELPKMAEEIQQKTADILLTANWQQTPGYEPVRLTYQEELASPEVAEKTVSSENSTRENIRPGDVTRKHQEKLSKEAVSPKEIPPKEIERRLEALEQGNLTQGSFGTQFPEAAMEQLWQERFVRELSIGDGSQKAEKAPGLESQARTAAEQLRKQQISQELLELEHPKMAEEIQQKTADILLAANWQQTPGYEPMHLTYQEESASSEMTEKAVSSEDSAREGTFQKGNSSVGISRGEILKKEEAAEHEAAVMLTHEILKRTEFLPLIREEAQKEIYHGVNLTYQEELLWAVKEPESFQNEIDRRYRIAVLGGAQKSPAMVTAGMEPAAMVYSQEENAPVKEQTVKLQKQVEEVVRELKTVEEKTIVQNRRVVEQQKQVIREVLKTQPELLENEHTGKKLEKQIQKSVEMQVNESIGQIANRVYRQIEDRLKVERGRRGLF